MKFLIVDENDVCCLLEDSYFEGLLDDCVVDIDLDINTRFLRGKKGDDSYTTPINIWGANRYTHTYNLRPTSAWDYGSITFKLNLSIATPLTPTGLMGYLMLSPYKSTTNTDNVLPAFGVSYVNNGIPRVCYGIFLYLDSSTGGWLKGINNYATFTNIDVDTLKCTGIYDNAKNEWVYLGNNV